MKKAKESFHISQPLSNSASLFPFIKKVIHSDGTMPYYIKSLHNQQRLTLPTTTKEEEELGIPPPLLVVPLLIFDVEEDGCRGLQTG